MWLLVWVAGIPRRQSPLTRAHPRASCRPRPLPLPQKKQFPRQMQAFLVDGASISIGACLGTPPLTVYVESASGIREGARTGLATLMIGFCFFISLFFSPLLATVPPYATGPALVLVGALMVRRRREGEGVEGGRAGAQHPCTASPSLHRSQTECPPAYPTPPQMINIVKIPVSFERR